MIQTSSLSISAIFFAEPFSGWRTIKQSAPIAAKLRTVSCNVSLLFSEEYFALKLIACAPSFFSATSKEYRVRVLSSKNKLTIVLFCNNGLGLGINSLLTIKRWVCFKKKRISSPVRLSISIRCFIIHYHPLFVLANLQQLILRQNYRCFFYLIL